MSDSADPVDFKALDALLDQAYQLDEPARARYVESLPEPQRVQLKQLLEVSHALTLKSIAAEARAVFDNADRPADGESTNVRSPAAGRWRLHKELGSGGMGQVFFATREAPTDADRSGSDYIQEAAIKVLWSLRADNEVRARFLRERRLLASLHHPGLARFVDGGFLADGRPWFAMEYVAGQTIDAHARDLSVDGVLRLFSEVCATVAYAHQRLIVHRDIKPLNVLVDESGHARLVDFGIAGVLEDIDDGVHTRTAGGPLTLQYASPEQLTGGVVTVASDIYQLGLLLYQMLTGRPPYDLKDAALSQALDVICQRMPPKPSTINPAIGPDLDAIVMTALAKDPDDRYRAATTLAEDVDRYLKGLPVHAVPQTYWYVARRFLRRNAAIASIVGISVLGLSAATVVSVRMANEATAQAARSEAAQQILSDVFQKADPFQGKGASVTLADALVRAKSDIAARVRHDPLLAWEMNNTLAQIYESLGLDEEARAAYEELLRAARQLGEGENHHRFLTGIAGVGGVLTRTNPVEAVRYFDAHLPAGPPSAEALNAWLVAQYSYVGALNRVRDFGRADSGTLAMAQAMDSFNVQDPRTRGRLSQLLAAVAKRAGDAEAEDRHWQDTVRHMRAAKIPSALAVTLSNWAIHLGRLKRYEESEAAFLEALGIFEDAGLNDPTFASVLRSYAGLLFRTDRINEAIAVTERALSFLPSDSQFYARFVAEQNLAQFHFVKGDVLATLAVISRALPAARKAFSNDPALPRRMLRLFAKALVFSDAADLASTAMGFKADGCTDHRLLSALEGLEHPKDGPPRTKIWKALDDLAAQAESGPLSQPAIDGFVVVYESEAPVFFDALDHWRVLHQLTSLVSAALLPAPLRQRLDELTATRQRAGAFVRSPEATAFTSLAHDMSKTAQKPVTCP